MDKTPLYRGGRNIALKVPPHLYDETVRFYREVLRLPVVEERKPSAVFEFGANQLWIDRMPGLSQAETWLEVVTDNAEDAAEHLNTHGIVRRDEIEPLPKGFQAFWVSSPAQIIHLVCQDEESM